MSTNDVIQLDVSRIIWMLIIAFIAMVVVQRVKLPYTVALVIAGLLVGATGLLQTFHISYSLIFSLFLPALLFDAAIRLPVDVLKRNRIPVVLLAVPGVILSTYLVGYAVHYTVGMSIGLALVFGALISATDPISVLALFKSLKVHTRLSIIVEGESLFNDGIAAVLYTALLAALVVNRTAGAGEIGLGFGRAIVGGVLIGGGIGWGISIIMSHINDHLIEITLTTIAAYGASLMADTLGTSGVISVISSGIVLGYYRGEASMSATTRAAVYSFWEYIAFAINSLLFLLIGIDVTIPSMTRNITPMFIAIAVVLFARMAVVYLTGAMLSPTASAISLKWQNVLVWGGLRGALAIALALGLPRDLPGRDVVLAMTYGVVLWTILPQGLSMGWFLKKLGLAGAREVSDDYGRIVTQLLADRAALKEIENMGEEHTISRRIYAEITTDLRMEIASLEQQLEDMQEGMAEMTAEQRREAYRRLIAAQQNAMRHAWETGIASDDTISELIARLYERYNVNEE